MLRPGQHGAAIRSRTAIATLLAIVILCTSCGDTNGGPSGDLGAMGRPSVTVGLPTVRIDRMRSTDRLLGDATAASLEAIHPEEVRDVLASEGFVGAWERVYSGRVGAFARVVLRAWQFRDAQGAGAYLAWLGRNPREWIGSWHPIRGGGTPPAVTVVMHDVSGCCHEETPIYLASWQRDAVVWTVRASGPRIRTAPVLDLVTDVELKV